MDNRPVGEVVKDIPIGAVGLEFDPRAGQIGHCLQPLATAATFLCCPGVRPRRWAPPLVARFDMIPRLS